MCLAGGPCAGDHVAPPPPQVQSACRMTSFTCSWQVSYSCILWGVRWAHLLGLPVQDLITFVYLSCEQTENLSEVSLVNSLTVLSFLLERWEGWEKLQNLCVKSTDSYLSWILVAQNCCSLLMCTPIITKFNGSAWLHMCILYMLLQLHCTACAWMVVSPLS